MEPMEPLLEDVAADGWSAESREQFVRLYDREIGETILHLLVEYGLLVDRRALRSLKSYVESRLQGQRTESEHPLWEIVEEVYMSIYQEVFQKKLIENYVEGAHAGTIKADFVSYLRGAVRRRLIDVLGAGSKSEKELFDAIVDSAKPQTRRQYIAEAKGRFREKARSYLLCTRMAAEESTRQLQRRLQAVIDYFFERFISEEYPALRAQMQSGASALSKLLDTFTAELSAATSLDPKIAQYVGQVAPSLPRHKRFVDLQRAEINSDTESEEEALERAGTQTKMKDWAQPERLIWWDRLLRCRMPSHSELQELNTLTMALEGDAQRDTRLCLACAQLKAESPPEQRDDLRMFLVYYLSNYGASTQASGEGELLTRDGLSLEKIRGRAISWEKIFILFGRECNPTRIKNRIREKFEVVQGGRS